jgi:hypothetical protein
VINEIYRAGLVNSGRQHCTNMTTKTAPVLRTVRRAKVQWVSNADTLGEVETKEIDVFYFSPTTKELKAAQAEALQKFKDDPNTIIWASDKLIDRIHSIPEKKVGEGQEFPLTIDWLDEQDMTNIRNIREGIEADQAPKAQPPK